MPFHPLFGAVWALWCAQAAVAGAAVLAASRPITVNVNIGDVRLPLSGDVQDVVDQTREV